MMITHALALVLIQADPAPGRDFSPIEVRSADGQCIARIDRAAGQERAAANVARYTLTVSAPGPDNAERVLWSVLYPFDGSPARYVVANRGRAFVELEEHFSESHTVLLAHFQERESVKLDGARLAIPREKLGGTNAKRTWLADHAAARVDWHDGAFGPSLGLEIPGHGEWIRRVDLERMVVIDGPLEKQTPRIEPAIEGSLPERCAIPYLQSIQFPPVARAGRALDIQIVGNHATPGWRFLGFELETDGDRWIVTPRSEAPEGIAVQVLTAFRTTARLTDLPVGRFTLEFGGWNKRGEPLTLEVISERMMVRLVTSGGFAGIHRQIEVHEQSIARRAFHGRDPEYVEWSDERMERLRELIARLPPKNRRARTQGAADLFQQQLDFWSGEKWVSIDVDDLAATKAEEELINALCAD